MIRSLITFALSAFITFSAHAAPEPGTPAPDFTAQNTFGKKVKLSDLSDKTVVLEWSNHECPFVRKFYDEGHMQKLQKQYTNRGVVWLRIISSAPEKQGHTSTAMANEIIKEKGINATHTILDETGEIGRLYDAKTTPHMFIIHKGTLAYMGAIDSIRSPKSDDIAIAEPYVENTLNSLLTGEPVEPKSTQPYGCSIKY